MYKYNIEEFEKKFLEITKLTVDNVLISTGGVGFNFMSPGWRDSL
ncbi:group-specific protein [Bacillus thuringiensis MC28]|nr:group-specific protein [Bacillus thuringiensis MC28]